MKFSVTVKKGFNNYETIIIEAKNRLEAYNKMTGKCGKDGKVISVKEFGNAFLRNK